MSDHAEKLSLALEVLAESRIAVEDAQAALERHVAHALVAGGSLRLVAKTSGLAVNTVIRIRKDQGLIHRTGGYSHD